MRTSFASRVLEDGEALAANVLPRGETRRYVETLSAHVPV